MKHLVCLALLASYLSTACSRVDSVGQYGIRATLIDASSGRPASQHPVRVTVNRQKFDLTSNRSGKITTPAYRFSYWTWLGGPMYGIGESKASIAIEAQGYRPLKFDWDGNSAAPSFPEKRGVIDLGNVKLHSR